MVRHAQIKRLGYNSGFNKGTFATNFDTREYFETHIRPQNKRNLVPGIRVNRDERNNATFIQYDKKQREDFQETVTRYLNQLTAEEKEQKKRQRREEELVAQAAALENDESIGQHVQFAEVEEVFSPQRAANDLQQISLAFTMQDV